MARLDSVEKTEAFQGTSRFRIIRQIGSGAMGVVYEAHDAEHDARVALKVLKEADPEGVFLLKSEFRAAQELHHPNLIRLYELFEEAGQWFFTMELLRGESFLAHVRRDVVTSPHDATYTARRPLDGRGPDSVRVGGMLDEARLRAALRQLALGLDVLHRAHKVHRDVKPSNVLVTEEGRVVLLDFGIVRDARRAVQFDEGMVGTVRYMAPEQATGEPVSPAADWYAVGVVLYQALTGHLPFRGTMRDVLAHKLMDAAPSPFDIDPNIPRDLGELCTDLLQTTPSERPSQAEIVARLGVTWRSSSMPATSAASFVGRDAELLALERALDGARAGQPVAVVVEGESGIGKSRLLGEFVEQTIARGNAVALRGRCYERESLPYKALDDLVDELAARLARAPDAELAALLPPSIALVRKVFPVLARVPAIGAPPSEAIIGDAAARRARVFASFRALIGNLARRVTLLLVIDDLQWADADSLALLADVLRPPHAPPVLLLASRRIESEAIASHEDVLARLAGDVRYIRLEPLPENESRALAASLLAERGVLPSRDLDAVLAEAKGHPLYLDELLRRETATPDASPRLDDALWARAQRLPKQALAVLEAVAAFGAPITRTLLASAARFDTAVVFNALATLRAAALVRTSGTTGATVDTYHDRVRESVLARLTKEARSEWHRRFAAALEATEGSDPEALAFHYRGAGDAVRAAHYLVIAADRAADALAFDLAVRLYASALDLAPPRNEAELRAVRVRYGEALANAGRGALAARTFLAIASTSRARDALDLRRRAGELYMCSGRFTEGRAEFERLLGEIGVRVPHAPWLVVAWLLVLTFLLRVRGLRPSAPGRGAVDPDALFLVDCLYSTGAGCAMTDHVLGKLFYARAAARALAIGEPFRVARSVGFYLAAKAAAGGPVYDDVMRHHQALVTMARDLADPYVDGMTLTVEGYAAYFSGRFKQGADRIRRAEIIFRDQCVGATYELSSMRTLLLRAFASLGELDELESRAPAILREAERRGDLYTEINVRSHAMVLLALARDAPAAATIEIERAMELLPPRQYLLQHYFCLLGRVQTALYCGDGLAAERALEEAWPALRRSLLLTIQPVRLILLDARARAALAVAKAHPELATTRRKTAARAARAIERERMPWAVPHAQMVRAALAEDRTTAGARIDEAIAGFDAADMALAGAFARLRRSALDHGTSDGALHAEADPVLARAGVRDPSRMIALYAPPIDL